MTPDDYATLHALIESVDIAAQEHERIWGMDRLPTLVDDELRAKFYRQQSKWSAAVEQAYDTGEQPLTLAELATVTELTNGLKRGWAAMGLQAQKNGAQPVRADIWEFRLNDGSIGALVKSAAEAGHVLETGRDAGRYVAVWTLDEIANVIAVNLKAAVLEAKVALRIPGKADRSWIAEGDAIPFGNDRSSVDVLADFD
jgi:hypothetical protein